MAQRLRGRFGYPADDPFRVTFHLNKYAQPLKWKKPRKIFVCSMGDLFHPDVEYTDQCSVLYMVVRCEEAGRDHVFLLLTKRPETMKRVIGSRDVQRVFLTVGVPTVPNLWLGVTAENQKRADERIPVLLQIPAAKRFVSIEPMLGPVDLEYLLAWHCPQCNSPNPQIQWPCPDCKGNRYSQVDWVIVGGETGPGARPMNPDWARSVRDQCREAGVPFFVKQMSGTGKEKQRIPVDLQIREWPDARG
jgi:protein gp37